MKYSVSIFSALVFSVLASTSSASELLLINNSAKDIEILIWHGKDEFSGNNVHNENLHPGEKISVNPDNQGNAGQGRFCGFPLYIYATEKGRSFRKLTAKRLKVSCGNGRSKFVVK